MPPPSPPPIISAEVISAEVQWHSKRSSLPCSWRRSFTNTDLEDACWHSAAWKRWLQSQENEVLSKHYTCADLFALLCTLHGRRRSELLFVLFYVKNLSVRWMWFRQRCKSGQLSKTWDRSANQRNIDIICCMKSLVSPVSALNKQSNAYYVLALCELDGKYTAYQWKSIHLLTNWRFQAQLAHWALQLGSGSRHE